MHVVAERFIELSVIMYYRPLTTVELKEFFESYQWLIWQHEICAMIEKLEGM